VSKAEFLERFQLTSRGDQDQTGHYRTRADHQKNLDQFRSDVGCNPTISEGLVVLARAPESTAMPETVARI
jgi:hypothetical protein